MGTERSFFSRSLILAFMLSCALAGYAQVTLTAGSGTASGSFTTLKGAFDAINAGTHQGAIVISINSSTTETASAMLNASGSGSCSYTGISIIPTTTGLSISGNLSGPIIDLNGADNVIIDGRVNGTGSTRSLNIVNTSTSNTVGTSTIRFINEATSNTVKYCTLKGSTTATDGGIVFFSISSGVGNDNNTIDNNDITCAGTNRPLYAVFAQGSSGFNNDNNTISNNNIYNVLSTTIGSRGISIANYNSGYTISGNSFYETTSFVVSGHSTPYYVISINAVGGTENGFTISGNYIGGSAALCTGAAWTKTNAASENNGFYAISVSTATGTATSIQGNTIQNINWTNGGQSNFWGIYIFGATVANIGTDSGNTIGSASGTGSIYYTGGATSSSFVGISAPGSGIIDCRNNTIAGITTSNASTNSNHFYGINCQGTAAIYTIIGNTIGSRTIPGSIHASSASTSASQVMFGIRVGQNTSTVTCTISGNIVANMVNATTNATTATGGFNMGINVFQKTVGTVTGNTVHNLSNANSNASVTNTASVSGIVIAPNLTNAQTVSGNTVYNLSNSYSDFTGAVTGIFFYGSSASTPGTISGNFIHSLSVTGASSTTARIRGIMIEDGASTCSNNIISLGGSSNTNLYGIYETCVATKDNNFYFNTVFISGNLSSGASNTSYALYSALNTNTRDLRNNILVNARSTVSGVSKHYALYAVSGGTLTCDHNQYYVSGTGGVLGYFGGDRTTLPIVTGATGNDAASIATDPAFSSTGTTASGYTPSAAGWGVTGTGITTDYTGSARSSTAVSTGAYNTAFSWSGSSGTDWTTASNWTPGTVPAVGQLAYIPSGLTNYPAVPSDRTISSLSLASGASLNLYGNTLTLTSALSNAGSITATTGKLSMAGSSAQTISGTGTIGRLEINNSAGVTITSGAGNMQTITGMLTPTAGTLTTNGNLTLKSDASGTARVGALGAGTSISGDVIAERYMPQNANSGGSGRAWRLVSIPVSGAGTLRHFFMNGRSGQDLTQSSVISAETANSGTPIVGHNYATATDANNAGFDWIGVANQVSSLRSFVGNSTGGTFLSQNVPSLSTAYNAAAQGYMLFARGDRKLTFPSTSSSGATTLRSTGALKTGNQLVSVVPASTSKYTLVGNPYMSVLDLSVLHTANSSVINPSFWIWDANIAGVQKQGAYVNVFKSGSTWVTNTGTYTNPERIESGMAFFVEPVSGLATATDITITEAQKSTSASAGLVPFGTAPADDHGRMFVRLEAPDSSGSRQVIDGIMADFHTSFRESLGDMSDREKMRNTISQGALWLNTEQHMLSSEGLPWPGVSNRSLRMYMAAVGNQSLILRVDPRGMEMGYVKAWLKDHHLGRESAIDMAKGLDYAFTGTGNASSDSTRFEIVYVERGRPATGGTVTPDDASEAPTVKLFPNPSKTGDVKLSLRAMAPGAYSFQLLDMLGREMATGSLEHKSINGEYRVLKGKRLSPGQYLIRLSIEGKTIQTLTLIQE